MAVKPHTPSRIPVPEKSVGNMVLGFGWDYIERKSRFILNGVQQMVDWTGGGCRI